ncbi:MAG: hypothetical protein AAB784_00660 [Patescibacteria group bacterium]
MLGFFVCVVVFFVFFLSEGLDIGMGFGDVALCIFYAIICGAIFYFGGKALIVWVLQSIAAYY